VNKKNNRRAGRKFIQAVATAAPAARTHSLAERAYLEIRNNILRGDLPVGAVLSRRKLAEGLNISVLPVSEALQRLEQDGLVESRPRVGTRVRIPTREDVEDRSLVREALETQAARLFAERATASEKKELRQMGQHMDQLYAAAETDPTDRDFLFSSNTYHMKLHLRIAEWARCPALRDAIEKEQVLIFNWLFDTAAKRRTLGSNFHTRLTDTLAGGTPEAAATAMRHHIQRGLNDVVEELTRIDVEQKNAWRPSKVSPQIATRIRQVSLNSPSPRPVHPLKRRK
jgi:DNA-binding GntR family transcriptional regulator